MAKEKKSKAEKRERRERRFLPQSTTKPLHVMILGGGGAVLLGAGVWAQFGHALMNNDLPPYPFAPWVLVAGAAVFGGAVWLGTSGEPAIRAGAAGVGIEKGQLQRIPWYAVERITWDADEEVLRVRGTDEIGKQLSVALSPKSHPQAVAWIVKEARDRIPKVVDVPDDARGLPQRDADAGEVIVLDAVQVVGKRCADSNKVIAYEPDARVCTKCERVYHKLHVPDECACGASLASLRAPAAGEAGGGGVSGEPAAKGAAPPEKDLMAKG
jgi:hypothetical protein